MFVHDLRHNDSEESEEDVSEGDLLQVSWLNSDFLDYIIINLFNFVRPFFLVLVLWRECCLI